MVRLLISSEFLLVTLREKCPYSELFWSVFSRIRTEYGEILRISLYSVRMRENTDQNMEIQFLWLMWIDLDCCRFFKSTEDKLLIILIAISWTIVFEKKNTGKIVCLTMEIFISPWSYIGPVIWNRFLIEKKVEYFQT